MKSLKGRVLKCSALVVFTIAFVLLSGYHLSIRSLSSMDGIVTRKLKNNTESNNTTSAYPRNIEATKAIILYPRMIFVGRRATSFNNTANSTDARVPAANNMSMVQTPSHRKYERRRRVPPLTESESTHNRYGSIHEPLPINQSMCRPLASWQTKFHPTCCTVHEMMELRQLTFLGSGGWRMAFMYQEEDEVIALKMLKPNQEFDKETHRRHQTDSIISAQLTSSPYVVNAYGFCGQSILTEMGSRHLMRWVKDIKKEGKSRWNETLQIRAEFARDIALAVADLHQLNGRGIAAIAHHDIKPQNIVLLPSTASKKKNGTNTLVAKLNDHNDAELLWYNTTSNSVCKFRRRRWFSNYISPEASAELPLTHAIDIFALGGVFYHLLTKKHPFDGLERDSIMSEIANDHFPEVPKSITGSKDPRIITMLKLVKKCRHFEPADRPSAQEVADAMSKMLEKQ